MSPHCCSNGFCFYLKSNYFNQFIGFRLRNQFTNQLEKEDVEDENTLIFVSFFFVDGQCQSMPNIRFFPSSIKYLEWAKDNNGRAKERERN